MQLGYVGLGNMGAALAKRLLLKHKMRLYDLRPERMAGLAALGGIASQSPKALAADSDLVMTCLPTSKEVQDAIFAGDGLAAGLKKGSIIADMTTGDPNATRAMARDLATAGITLIDAPVSGGPQSPSWSAQPPRSMPRCSRYSRALVRTFSTAAPLATATP